MSTSSSTAQFGPNEWLVDEMYQRYLADPASVDAAWHEFFTDYAPDDGAGVAGSSSSSSTGAGSSPDAAEATGRGSGTGGAARSAAEPDAAASAGTPSASSARATGSSSTTGTTSANGTTSTNGTSSPGASANGTGSADGNGTAPAGSAADRSAAAPASAGSASGTTTSAGTTSGSSTSGSSTSGGSTSGGSASGTGAPGGNGTTGPGATTGARSTPTSGAGEQTEPAKPAAGSTGPARAADPAGAEQTATLRGASAAIAKNMNASLTLPTATSVRAVPAKLLADNRIVINNHLRRTRGGKVSFTHLLGYAMVRALAEFPTMNRHYGEDEKGRPASVSPGHVNLGLAMDLPGKDGSRSLVVVALKGCEDMNFSQFWSAYEEVVRKARGGGLTAEDFSGVTISLTNPGTIGTNHSVPRLTVGQGTIVGVGAMEYPAEFQGASDERLANNGISKIITLTSTYDHRIIQGAESGDFLRRIHRYVLGEDGFYDEIFAALRIPYEPIRWAQDLPESGIARSARVLELIDAYRMRGHLMADTDPLDHPQRRHPDLDIQSHELTLWDLDREFCVDGFAGRERMKLRDVLGVLRDSYCRTTGIEYMHILDPEKRAWLQERVEVPHERVPVAEQKYILSKLNAAEAFEAFLQTKYVGQKRFSLEGAETVIPLLDTVLDTAAAHDLDEVVIGMPHRGRLNVLANIVGKPVSQIFREFEGNLDPGQAHGSGDVKYHLGAEGKFFRMFGDGEVTVSLTSNPSHLEAVDPVLEGIVRAKQDLLDKGPEGFTVLPVAMHGDAAFAGQGVVAETLNLALLRGYRTGGTVHVVVNNQVGFTTAPEHTRSSQYCTDVAKMIDAPIFHVNGDDPEACVWVARLAVEFRERWNSDVVIDMICYRRRGHNEGDDPSMTQPGMYDVIDSKRSVRKTYTESLIGRGDISLEEAEHALRDYGSQLEHVFNEVRELEKAEIEPSPSVENEQAVPNSLQTAVSLEVVQRIARAHLDLPEDFAVHPRVRPVLERRAKAASTETQEGIDWAYAELLAFGSLLIDGKLVRLSGQDSRRGTFVQRHSVVIDRRTGEEYVPLRNLTADQGRFMAYDSALSEFAAVGFEYGYSVVNHESLVLWEAQFGDFVNGAQSIIDEFISSGEAKWGQTSDVVLLLPHGHEGQGPDHTSGRIERFLQLCAEGSMTVALPSSPANYFHLLRRHATDGVRRPLVVFTPKSMLRNKAAVSPVEEFTSGGYRPVIDDPTFAGTDRASAAQRVLFCAGKIYYELVAARAKAGRDDAVAIVRLEQLYPVAREELSAILGRYPADAELRWVQEEPANQGAWPFLGLMLPERVPELGGRLRRISRRRMAAPAAGVAKVHEVEQRALIAEAIEA